METDTDMHNDGSPLGNGRISSEAYKDMAICPDLKCSFRGDYWKCYLPCFAKCATYLGRQVTEDWENSSDSNLTEIASS